MALSTSGHWFIDDNRRKILLRGVNLGGSTKVPYDGGATHLPTNFSDHREVSFVNRPFPLEESDEHFNRLKSWGFNTLRLLTVWEAIEHAGPGKYDTTYLDYFTKIVEIAGDYDFFIFIDPHQDVWSRMTGGDGAPGWTFEKVGLDFTTFDQNGAAKVMQYHYPHNYNQMEWFLNYTRFACATMFTLFFGSEDFAPEATIEGQSIQKYLQSHFINAIAEIAKRVKDFDHVIGFDSLNEPGKGYIGIEHLDRKPVDPFPGLIYSPFDTLAAGSGYPREVERYKRNFIWIRKTGDEILNPRGISSWLSPDRDIWMNHGVFDEKNGNPRLLQPDYFTYRPDGSLVDFPSDYLRPFAIDYITTLREIIPDTLLFLESDPQEPKIVWYDSDPGGVVNASHWYDGFTLFTKNYRSWITAKVETRKPVFFARNVRDYHRYKLSLLKEVSDQIHKGIPTLVGEFGIPFDMNNARAYKTGDYSAQIKALSSYYDIMDELRFHTTLWNYTSDNINQWGDLWNNEDLSIFSKDQQTNPNDINSGGRALKGFIRPYPMKIAGNPTSWKFYSDTPSFKFSYTSTSDTSPTEIFIPKIYFDHPRIRITPELKYDYDNNSQLLSITDFYDGQVLVYIENY